MSCPLYAEGGKTVAMMASDPECLFEVLNNISREGASFPPSMKCESVAFADPVVASYYRSLPQLSKITFMTLVSQAMSADPLMLVDLFNSKGGELGLYEEYELPIGETDDAPVLLAILAVMQYRNKLYPSDSHSHIARAVMLNDPSPLEEDEAQEIIADLGEDFRTRGLRRNRNNTYSITDEGITMLRKRYLKPFSRVEKIQCSS